MIWSVADLVSTVVVAGMGAFLVLTSYRPKDRAIIVWFSAFVVLAAFSVAVKTKQDTVLEEKITGGDNYSFVQVKGPGKVPGKYAFQVTNQTGIIPFVTFGAHQIDDNGGASLIWGWTRFTPSLKTTIDLGLALSVGNYRIDFFGSNGVWRQHLKLREEKGELIEITEIVGDDGTIIRPIKTRHIKISEK